VYTIYAEFQRFRDINLVELIGAAGVYVIWDAHSKARPTYIGEGNILKRFTDHVKRDNRRFAHPWNGYVAIIAGSTRDVHKYDRPSAAGKRTSGPHRPRVAILSR
jgi:hypothetical protein